VPGARLEWPRLAGLLLAGALALALAHSVYRIPIQVGDSLDVILVSRHPPTSLSLLEQAARWSPTTLRPMRYLQARWLSTLADAVGVSHHAAFRGVHALLVLEIIGLFVWIVDPRRWIDVAALGFSLTVLVGLHTFDAMLRESFPVNHFAEVAAAALFVVAIAQRPPRLAGQLLALALLVAGLLLIESAVLLWLLIVAAVAIGMPGVRRWTAVAATVAMVLFVLARVALEISAPGIGSHSSGWGGATLSGEELQVMFAGNPWPFYLYNVTGGGLSLIASEPRFGVYQLLAARESGSLSPVVIINLTSSLVATALIVARGLCASRVAFRNWTLEHKTLALGAVTIAASSVLCATYIKDDILGVAGVLYAAMSFMAARWLLELVEEARPSLRLTVAASCLVIAAGLWGFRAVGTHYDLRRAAFTSRNDWALQSQSELAGGPSASREDVALAARLRREALRQPVTSPSFLPDWGERYWVE
jgi:hypothetical protein